MKVWLFLVLLLTVLSCEAGKKKKKKTSSSSSESLKNLFLRRRLTKPPPVVTVPVKKVSFFICLLNSYLVAPISLMSKQSKQRSHGSENSAQKMRHCVFLDDKLNVLVLWYQNSNVCF